MTRAAKRKPAMSPTRPPHPVDGLIETSKRLTTELMTLKHDLQTFRTAAVRPLHISLLRDRIHIMRQHFWLFREMFGELDDAVNKAIDAQERSAEMPDEQFFLSAATGGN